MQSKELIKKYWFVLILAVLSVVFIGFYAVESSKNAEKKITALSENGQSVIYTINGENYYADDLYSQLEPRFALTANFSALDRFVTDASIKTTKEMQALATNNAQYLLSTVDKAQLDKDLRSMGFNGIDDLANYYIYLQKNMELSKQYFIAHQAEYVDPYITEKEPKSISHILVKVADVQKTTNEDGTTTLTANPTEEEQAKLDAILKALGEGEDFAKVAIEHSEDGSAQNGGYLGLVDKDSAKKYVKEFADAAMNLKEGDVSEVVVTEFGYHIIKCNTSTAESLLNSQEFLSNLFNKNSNLYTRVIIEKANELGISIEDAQLKAEIEKLEISNESEEQA